MDRAPTPTHITIKIPLIDAVLRIWLDIKAKPYKIEVRSPEYQGYHNVDEFPKIINILSGQLKNAGAR